MRKLGLIIIPIMIVCLWGMSCTHQVAGGGTDTESGGTKLYGYVGTPEGVASQHVKVTLVPSSYNPLSNDSILDTAETDIEGTYKFDNVAQGNYNLQSLDSTGKKGFLLTGITASALKMEIPNATLKKTSTVFVALPDIVDTVNGYVYMPGTTLFKKITSQNNYIVFDSVPSGALPAIYYREKKTNGNLVLLSDTVKVLPDDTIAVSPWQNEQKIMFNTTMSGVAISSNVYHFPVLIRLTNSNFTFSKAKASGQDIRFYKRDNSPVAFEIQRYDSNKGLAEIWVKLDTLFANDSLQYITMRYGAASGVAGSAVMSLSNSNAVFAEKNGFVGVWHLDEGANEIGKDATGNGYSATPMGKTAPSDTLGVIGNAKRFDGLSSYFDMKGTANSLLDFPVYGTYTISAWVNVDTLDSTFQALVYKGSYQYALQIRKENAWEINEYTDNNEWDGVPYKATARVWKYVVGVRDGKKQKLYIDGQCVDSTIVVTTRTAGAVPRNTTLNLQISHSVDGDEKERFFKGAIDEVCMASVVRSADWVKLCFMNQKESNSLVMFKK